MELRLSSDGAAFGSGEELRLGSDGAAFVLRLAADLSCVWSVWSCVCAAFVAMNAVCLDAGTRGGFPHLGLKRPSICSLFLSKLCKDRHFGIFALALRYVRVVRL